MRRMSHGCARRRAYVVAHALPRVPPGTARSQSERRLRDVPRGSAPPRRKGRISPMKRLVLAAVLVPAMLGAQGVRISGVTTMQYVELRPLLTDSVPASTVPDTGQFRTAAYGVPAVCDSLFC